MWKNLLPYYLKYKCRLGLALAGAALVAILELLFPMYLRYIMQQILPTGNIERLVMAAGGLLVAYLVTCAINYFSAINGRLVGALIEQDLRRELFQHVEKLSFSYYDNQRLGQLVSRIVSDVGEIRELIFLGPNYLLVCLFMMCGTVIILFCLNWKLALVVNLLLVGKAWDSVVTNRKLKKAGREARSQVGNLNAQTTESLNAIRLVQSYTNEDLELKKLDKVADRLLQARKNSFELLAHTNTSMVFFSNVTNLVIIVLGGTLIALHQMRLSDLVTFLLYVSVFIRPVLRLNALADVYQKGVAGYQRFAELLAVEPEIKDEQNAQAASTLHGDIKFTDISFAYADREPVIKNFTLEIPAGQKVALVGATGIGKSTICNLLPRFYEPQTGTITIDGQDINKMTLASLRRNIGIVQQDIFLFSASAYENILYGRPDASEKEVLAAAELAEVDSFVQALPQKYDTELGEKGVKLSGGQKQRLAIARAILKNPPIMIFDEATSSLDNETEKNIQQALDKLSQNRTTLIVAHRLATVINADRIVVLGSEGILEQGTHAELLALKGEYYRLYMTQFLK